MGFKTKDIADYIIETLELPLTRDEFKEEIVGLYQELFPHTNPMPGNVLYQDISDVFII